jgi:hypothetical protein
MVLGRGGFREEGDGGEEAALGRVQRALVDRPHPEREREVVFTRKAGGKGLVQ